MAHRRRLSLALALAGLAASARDARAVSCNWLGTAGDGNFYTISNWDVGSCPGTGNDLTIDLNGLVSVSVSSPGISANSLTLGNSAGSSTIELKVSTGVLSGGTATLHPGSTLRFDGVSTNVFTTVNITTGATGVSSITATGPFGGGFPAAVRLKAATLNIAGGARITAAGMGYSGGAPTVAGSGDVAACRGNQGTGLQSGGGGGGGGSGGQGAGPGGLGGSFYGSGAFPNTYGCGGGGGGDGAGGAGGGVIYIDALTINQGGLIDADGSISAAGASTGGGGGGGGSIQIIADTLVGVGTITARGGNGASGGSGGGGGGGGGRIALRVVGNLSAAVTLYTSSGTAGTAAGLAAVGTTVVDPAWWLGNGASINASDFANWYATAPTNGGSVIIGPLNPTKDMNWDLPTAAIPVNTAATVTVTTAYLGNINFTTSLAINQDLLIQRGTFTLSALANLQVARTLSQTGGKFNLTQGTVTFNGATGQTAIFTPDSQLCTLRVTGGGTSVTVLSDLRTIGHMDVGAAANLSLSAGTTWFHKGDILNLGTLSASAGHKTVLESLGNQTSYGMNFGSLHLVNGARTVSFPTAGTLNIQQDLRIDPGAVLISSVAGQNIDIRGDWSNSGTFDHGTGSNQVIFSSPGVMGIVAGGSQFRNLTLNNLTGTLNLSTSVAVAANLTLTTGTLNLSAATVNVRANWFQTGGMVSSGTSVVVFDGAGAQTLSVTASSPTSSFNTVISSPGASLTLSGAVAIGGNLEIHRSFLNYPGASLTVGGDYLWKGGAVPPGHNTAGSTVTFKGSGLQVVDLSVSPGNVLGNVVSSNTAGLRLGSGIEVKGNFTVSSGTRFDGAARVLEFTQDGSTFSTVGSSYVSAGSNAHLVRFNSLGGAQTTYIADGTVIDGGVDVFDQVVVRGSFTIRGSANNLNPQTGAVLDARDSWIRLEGTSELAPSAGGAWTYIHDATSTIIYEGAGLGRGTAMSSSTLGNLRVNLDSISNTFGHSNMNLDGGLTVDSGTFSPNGNGTLSLKGDFKQNGGLVDYVTYATGTVRFTGSSAQTVLLQPGSTLEAFVVSSSSEVIASTPLDIQGNFSVLQGTFTAGNSTHTIGGNWNIAGVPGTGFKAQGSTLVFNGAVPIVVSQPAWTQYNGLIVAASSVSFSGGFSAVTLTEIGGSTLAFSPGSLNRVASLTLKGTSTTNRLRLRSMTFGVPWGLDLVGVSTVTAVDVQDSNATPAGCLGCLTVQANDGNSVNGGGNINWNFAPGPIITLPGQTFTDGVGNSGVPWVHLAGSTMPVTVRAVSSNLNLVAGFAGQVNLLTSDPNDDLVTMSSAAAAGGVAAFTVSPRTGEPAPFTSTVTASGPLLFGSTAAPFGINPGALAKVHMLLPGQSPIPGSTTGVSGIPFSQVAGQAFSATVRGTDAFFNLVPVADSVRIATTNAPSSNLPTAGQALAAGVTSFGGLIINTTGLFTLRPEDLTTPSISSVTSSTAAFFAPTNSSPTATLSIPNGSTVTTLSANLVGTASDLVAVNQVRIAVKELATNNYFDWGTQVFSSPGFQDSTTTLTAPASPFTGWSIPLADSKLTTGRQYLVHLTAINSSSLVGVDYTTFTFNPGVLVFGGNDGKGSAFALPAVSSACESVVATVTFTVGGTGVGNGGAIALRVPEGWTVPVGTTTAMPPPLGFARIVSTSAALGPAKLKVNPDSFGNVVLGSGWLLIEPAGPPFNPGEQVTFFYSAFPAFGPQGLGPQVFDMRSQGGFGGSLVSITTAPLITANPGTTNYLYFSDYQPLFLGPLQTSATMQLRLTDICGNPKTAPSNITVFLSAGNYGPTGFDKDTTAVFYKPVSLATTTVTVAVGQSLSQSFHYLTSTSGVTYEFIRATATMPAPASNFVETSRFVTVLGSPLAVTAVSIDTGTLSPAQLTAGLTGGSFSSFVNIRFTVADPEIPWEVVISTSAADFYPPVFRAFGMGDPARPQVVYWNGINTEAQPPQFAFPGAYRVLIKAGGGVATNSQLTVNVLASPSTYGNLGARGAGAFVNASGQGSSYGNFAVASSTGYFHVFGLNASQRYNIQASTGMTIDGQLVFLTTGAVNVLPVVGGTNAGTLAFPTTSFIRVSVTIPTPAPQESWGSVFAHNPNYTSTAFGSLHFSSGAATSDNGAQIFGQNASTWTVLVLSPDTYDLEVGLFGLGISTKVTGLALVSGARLDASLVLPKKANIFGYAVLPSTAAFGSWVSVQGLRQGDKLPSAFGGAFIPPPSGGVFPTSGTYGIFGLDPGTWTLTARTQGFTSVSSVVLVTGLFDIGTSTGANGIDLTLGLGGIIRGTVTVNGDTSQLPCQPGGAGQGPGPTCPPGTFSLFVDAYNPLTFSHIGTTVFVATSAVAASSTFSIAGLESGPYVLNSHLKGFDPTPPGGVSVLLSTPSVPTAVLNLGAVNARARLDIQVPPLPAGACHSTSAYKNVGFMVTGPDVSFAAADITTMTPVMVTPNKYMSATDDLTEEYFCSSMTFVSPPTGTGYYRFGLTWGPSGAHQLRELPLINGVTTVYTIDLRASSFTVTGNLSLSGNVTLSPPGGGPAVTVSSMTGLLAQIPDSFFCLLTSSNPIAAKTPRLELVPFDSRQGKNPPPLLQVPNLPGFCRALDLSQLGTGSGGGPPPPFPSFLAYVSSVQADGFFSFKGVPAGTYLLRNVPDLDLNPGNGLEIAEIREVLTITSSTSLGTIGLTPGVRVSGTVYLPQGVSLSRPFAVRLNDGTGRVLRAVQLGFNNSNSASFTLDRIGEGAYSLQVEDMGFPKAYAAKPLVIDVGNADVLGQDLRFVPAGTIKAKIAIQQNRPDGTKEFVLVTQENAHVLPGGMKVYAIARPWFQGGFYQARGFNCGPDGCSGVALDSNGQITVEGVLPGTYDVELIPPQNDPSAGALVLAPVVVSGVEVAEGQTADLGTVNLLVGATLSGRVTDVTSGAPLANVRVDARPAIRQPGQQSNRRSSPNAATDRDGRYQLKGLDPVIRYFDVYAPFQGEERQGDVIAPYELKIAPSIDVASTTTLDFALTPANFTISGQVLSVGGDPLETPFGEGLTNAPGATVFIQKAGIIPTRTPVSDRQFNTDAYGNFTIPALTPGIYRITVTALRYVSLNRTVEITAASVNMGTLQLDSGATLTGKIRKPDGSFPSADEINLIVGATPDLSDFFFATLFRDPATNTIQAYRASGFRPNVAYRLLVVNQDDELVSPPEASNIVFTSNVEERSQDIVLRPSKPFVLAKAKRQGTDFLLDFQVSQPLRARTADDDVLALVLSTLSARGSLSGIELAANRMKMTALYTPGVGESSFTMRVRGYTGITDPDSLDPVNPEFLVVSTATFFLGIDGLHRASINNLIGGTLIVEGDAGRVTLPKGALSVDVSTTVQVTLQKSVENLATGPSRLAPAEANIRAMRYGPGGYPQDMFQAMAAKPPELSPFSGFYDVLLPLGVRTALAKPVQMCVSYSTGTDPANLNLYWYNTAANAYILQQDVTGAAPVIDTVKRTKCINVNHFSTFVLFNTGVAVITGNAFPGSEMEAFNFPNPFDLTVKVVTPIHGAGAQSVRGTMIRFGLPGDVSGEGKIHVFNVAGEKVRTIDLGSLAPGAYYYQGWDGRNDSGRDVASGVYIGQVKVGGKSKFFKMALIK